MPFRILVCDDEPLVRSSLEEHLRLEGYEVTLAEDGGQALKLIEEAPPDALIVDLKMPKMDGIAVLRALRDKEIALPSIVITARAGFDGAVEAIRLGAEGYLQKPFDLREVTHQLAKFFERRQLQTEVRYLRDRVSGGYERLIGNSPSMRRMFETLSRLEQVDSPTVLIAGESGTGKDLVAEAIHRRGPRKDKPYMQIDCAAMPETLIESELFGHEKGAFTDARTMKRGLFEVADGGVIFLDEIGEMPIGTQAKLLRALENRRFKRVGGLVDIPLTAAVIAATNKELKAAVAAGTFREDLYFRLNVVPIDIPPLRRRPDDVESIAMALLERAARELGRRTAGIDRDALDALRAYPWPGNVRELRNVIERVVILKNDDRPIHRDDLPEEIRLLRKGGHGGSPYVLLPEGIDLAAVERSFVEQALERCHGNQTQAAKLLGISRFALRHRIDRYDLGSFVVGRHTHAEPHPV
ncbi:MAG: sigma-54-dependent Fis family transcriptional regulator [Deltaproteobacteria bacterium]|nr:sigma-54-dependent Fis family transcriptional regulator [Deltaproteobacteria bacterium]